MRQRRLAAVVTALGGVVVLAALLPRTEPTISCPDSAALAEARPPAGRELWCERTDPGGNQIRHGPYRAWLPNGRLKIEGQFVEGRKAGRWTFWQGNGILLGRGMKKEEGEFRDGKEHGLWTRWHDFNVKLEEGAYRDGVRHGRWTFWYPIGQKEREGEYQDGQATQVWLRWTPKGEACPPEDLGPPVQPGPNRSP